MRFGFCRWFKQLLQYSDSSRKMMITETRGPTAFVMVPETIGGRDSGAFLE
jgi:hypothetical protein